MTKLTAVAKNEIAINFLGADKAPKCYIPGAYSHVATKKECTGKRNANGLMSVHCAACRAHKNAAGIEG